MKISERKDGLGKRPGMCLLALSVQIFFAVASFLWFLPAYEARDTQQLLLVIAVGGLALLLLEFAIRKLSDGKMAGLAWICLGFTLLFAFTEKITDTILIATGTTLIARGTRAFSLPPLLRFFYHDIIDGIRQKKNEKKE